MARRQRLYVETLEGRQLMAAFQMPWPEINQLTLSFVPDGVAVGQQSTSDLFRSLRDIFPNDDWQLDILRAFQTWAVETNANIGLVADDGSPLDSLGFKQGDTRFGDIRIGAFPMADDVLAVANPYDPFIANTWVGDVFLNNASHFLQDNPSPHDALYSLLLHEAGHVYGIPHSVNTASPMYPSFRAAGLPLTTTDIALLRDLYGARKADAWEGATGNQTIDEATPISLYNDDGDLIAPEWSADLARDDVDVYAIDMPRDITSLRIHLTASGRSLLTSQITVRDAAGQIVAHAQATDPRRNDVTLQLDQLLPGGHYTLEIQGTQHDVFSVGTYQLAIVPLTAAGLPATAESAESYPVDTSALEVLATTPGYVEHTYYEVEGALTEAQPYRTYQVRSVDLGPDLANIFTVIVGTEGAPIDDLQVSVLDAAGQPLPYVVVPNALGKLELQVSHVQSNADYFVRVAARNPAEEIAYEVEVDFAHDGTHTETMVNETLSDAQPVVSRTLHVSQSQQFQFLLGASDWSLPWNSGLEMEIRDAAGRTHWAWSVPDGAIRTNDVFLTPGDYSVTFRSPGRQPHSNVVFQLSGLTTSAPIGPQLRDTLHEPVDSAAAQPLRQLSFYWSPTPSTPVAVLLSADAPPSQRNTIAPEPSAATLRVVETSEFSSVAPTAPFRISGSEVEGAAASRARDLGRPVAPEKLGDQFLSDFQPAAAELTQSQEIVASSASAIHAKGSIRISATNKSDEASVDLSHSSVQTEPVVEGPTVQASESLSLVERVLSWLNDVDSGLSASLVFLLYTSSLYAQNISEEDLLLSFKRKMARERAQTK